MLSQSNLWRGSSRLTNTAVPTYRMSPADHEVSHQNNGPVTLMGASERFRNCIGGRSAPPGLLLPHLIMAANGCDRNGGSGLRRDCGLKTKAGGHANVPFSFTLTFLPSRWTAEKLVAFCVKHAMRPAPFTRALSSSPISGCGRWARRPYRDIIRREQG